MGKNPAKFSTQMLYRDRGSKSALAATDQLADENSFFLNEKYYAWNRITPTNPDLALNFGRKLSFFGHLKQLNKLTCNETLTHVACLLSNLFDLNQSTRTGDKVIKSCDRYSVSRGKLLYRSTTHDYKITEPLRGLSLVDRCV